MLKVKGMLKDLFRFDNINPELEEELILSLCNKPIINEDGFIIGHIDYVDLENNNWNGTLHKNCSLSIDLLKNKVQSISIIGR